MAFCFMAYLGVKNILRLGIDNVSASFTIDIRECLPGTVFCQTKTNKKRNIVKLSVEWPNLSLTSGHHSNYQQLFNYRDIFLGL